MEETIDLRALIETIWKGKWIISGITTLFMLASGILSWFVLPEQYESKATVQMASHIEGAGVLSSYIAAEFNPTIFLQRIKNETLMNEAFEESGLQDNFHSSALSTSIQTDANFINLTYQNSDAEKAQEHLHFFIDKTIEHMNTSVRNTLDDQEKKYKLEVDQLSSELETIIEDYNNLIISNGLPKILVMQTMVNSQILLTLTEENTAAIEKINGSLHNELIQLQTQIASKSTEYRNILDRYQSVKTELDSFHPDRLIRTIIEPTLAGAPSAPNKPMNVAIAMIIGLMASIGFIFFREYWRSSAPEK